MKEDNRFRRERQRSTATVGVEIVAASLKHEHSIAALDAAVRSDMGL
jgi:hypothetical protein